MAIERQLNKWDVASGLLIVCVKPVACRATNLKATFWTNGEIVCGE